MQPEFPAQRPYMSLESLDRISEDLTFSLPRVEG